MRGTHWCAYVFIGAVHPSKNRMTEEQALVYAFNWETNHPGTDL